MPIQEFTRPAARFTAVQWTGDNLDEIAGFAGDALIGSTSGFLTVRLSDGPSVVQVGWWLHRYGGTLGVCTDTVARDQGWEPVS